MSYRSDLYINEAASGFYNWSYVNEKNTLSRDDKNFLSNKRLSKNLLLDDDPNWWREQE